MPYSFDTIERRTNMTLLKLLAVFTAAVLLCKAIAIGTILLLFWIKGKLSHFDAAQWDAWFLTWHARKITPILVGIAIFSIVVSALAAYGLLNLLHFQNALAISLLFGALYAVFFEIRYYKSGGNEYMAKQIEKIHQSILQNR